MHTLLKSGLAAAVAGAALALAACAQDDEEETGVEASETAAMADSTADDATPAPGATVTTPAGGRTLGATLAGGMEVPGPGDADGTGTFTGRLDPATGQLCYTLTVANIGTATMAHIHTGRAGVAGGPVVTLKAPSGGRSEECVAVDAALAQQLLANPASYYVNAHNADYPDGAVRGQLSG